MEPDIIATKSLTVVAPNSVALDLGLGSKVTFNPGVAPQSCVISKDAAVLLPTLYSNLTGAVLVAALPGRLVFNVGVQDAGRPGVFAFRLKFEERRTQPKRLIILATLDVGRRTVTLGAG